MAEWTRTAKTAYWMVVIVLAFGVAWSLWQLIELHERADEAEQVVDMLSERPPRMPAEWTFDIDGGSLLHCRRLGNDPIYRCVPRER